MIKMVTIWKDIHGWEDYYEVNDDGEVRNKNKHNLLVGDHNSCGYPRVCLYNKNNIPQKQRFFRHRLVAEHFIPNPNNLDQVNHIDMDINNCTRGNLEWCNQKYNNIQARINRNRNYKPFLVEYNDGSIYNYDSSTDFSSCIGVSSRTVKNWLKGISSTYINYGIKRIEYIRLF